MPPADLDGEYVRPAASLGPAVPYRIDALLDLPGAPWQPVARTLLVSVHATGHRTWLAGGVVRDVVMGAPEWEINDLDLAGTVPPGRFTDVVRQSLRASRMSEFRTTVTRESLVCAVIPPRSNQRLIEYRALSVGGFRFPAVGSRLAEDVRHRDFTFNALFYDALDHELFDPSGSGVDDLIGDKRRFVPLKQTTDPYAQAEVVLRAMKFALRWADSAELDLDGLNAWISQLAPDLCRRLSRNQWRRLTELYRRSISANPAGQREFAAKVVLPGRELLDTLMGRAR